MAIIAEFSTELDAFPLGSLIEAIPTATVELERLVPVHPNLFPYLWVHHAEREDVQRGIEAIDGVTVNFVESIGDVSLLRADWEDDTERGLLSVLTTSSVELLDAVGTTDGWRFKVRGEDHEAIAAVIGALQEGGFSVRVHSFHRMVSVGDRDTLTDAQREAVVLAYQRGYYDTPRETTLEEIADELGISRQSLASRLRRGTKRLLEASLDV